MILAQAAELIEGDVWHTRVRPKSHKLHYRVFAMLFDVDRLDEAVGGLRLISRNRFNLLSFHDRDLGAKDGTAVAVHARETLQEAGYDPAVDGVRIELLTYPRVLGYVFNPLSVYFCRNKAGELSVLIYEVSNTYGERVSYVVPAGPPSGVGHDTYAHSCTKQMDVSPFTEREDAAYAFRLRGAEGRLTVGVRLSVAGSPILKTHFSGSGAGLSDRAIASCMVRYPLMTLKVITAIHFEALKLFLKRIPLVGRMPKPGFTVVPAKPVART